MSHLAGRPEPMLLSSSRGLANRTSPTTGRARCKTFRCLLVEQNVREALRAADTAYVLQTGRVVVHGPAADLIGDPLFQEAFLGIAVA